MAYHDGQKDGSDPVFDRLPPKVKREFFEKKHREELQAEEYAFDLGKMRIKGAIIGGVIGFGLGLMMGTLSLVLAAVLCVAEAGAGYLIVDRKPGHFTSVGLYAATAIVLPYALSAVGLSLINFFLLLIGWAFAAATGGMLGYWARTRETRFHARLD